MTDDEEKVGNSLENITKFDNSPYSEEEATNIINNIWLNFPIVDGLLEPHTYDFDFELDIASPTQTNVFSGKLTKTGPNDPTFEKPKTFTTHIIMKIEMM